MKRSFSENVIIQLAFLSAVVFLSRFPFLWAGFGAEEDSWLLAITAKNMALSGNYEMSRAPGHPLQEYLYSFLYNNDLHPFYTNLISAISSVIATLFFALSLRNLNFKHYLFAAFAFAFTPIVFISSTYTVDYMLAMACVMGAFYFITKPAVSPSLEGMATSAKGEHFIASGIMLGLAIGFRLTSAAMLLPFCIWLFFSPPFKGRQRGIGLLLFTTTLIGLLAYLPVLKTYGLSFFDYSDQFPYPNLPKVFFKLSLGVFGTIGFGAIAFSKAAILFKKIRMKEKMIGAEMPGNIFWMCLSVIILYTISYLRLPQKSAYLIPAVPFILLALGYSLSERTFKVFCVFMALSSFLFSINLTDSLRGSEHSPLAIKFSLAEQEIFIDPLTGPIFSDYTKRQNKMAYTREVFTKVRKEQNKTVLICGWWYNELIVKSWNSSLNPNVIPVFYIDKPTIEKYISEGYSICYLAEQNLYNDQFSQMNYTDSVAVPYM